MSSLNNGADRFVVCFSSSGADGYRSSSVEITDPLMSQRGASDTTILIGFRSMSLMRYRVKAFSSRMPTGRLHTWEV